MSEPDRRPSAARERGAAAVFAIAGLAMLAAWSAPASAQSYAEFVRRANSNTVSIVAGAPGDTSLEIANDLATVMHCVDGLRIVPIVGRGDTNNIYDLLFLRGVDMAIVEADVLDHVAEQRTYVGDLRDRVRYIAPLYDRELHLIARGDIASVGDLEGKLVNMGPSGSLPLAARRVLEAASVTVIESKFDTGLALERLLDGTLDAMFVSGGKPLRALDALKGVTGLALVPLSPPPGAAVYRAAEFTHDDYPSLVPAGATVPTIATPSVLAAYDWPADSERYAKNRLFTEVMFRRLGYLRRPARHPKWSSTDVAGEVPGWRRFEPAMALAEAFAREEVAGSAALLVSTASPDAEITAQFERQLAEFGITPETEDERRQLFEAFRRRVEATRQ